MNFTFPSNPEHNFGHQWKMTLKVLSYLLPKLGNKLMKNVNFVLPKSFSEVKNQPNLSNFFSLKNIKLGDPTFINENFWKKNIWKMLYFLKKCPFLGPPFFVIWFPSFGKRYESDLRAWIFSGVILWYGQFIGDFKSPTCPDVPGGKEKTFASTIGLCWHSVKVR